MAIYINLIIDIFKITSELAGFVKQKTLFLF